LPEAAVESKKAREQAERFANAVSSDQVATKQVNEAALREEFSRQLLARLAEMKTSLRDQVREELLADPSIGKAKQVVEAIVGLLGDFGADTAGRRALESRDQEAADLRKSLAEADQEIAEKDVLIEQLGAAAKEAGYRFQLERLISEDEDADTIRAQVGDVLGYRTAVALEESVVGIRGKLSAAREIRARQRRELEERESKLNSTAETLASSLQEALELNKRLGLQLYASKRLTNHPQAEKIRAMMEHVSLESTEQVDALLDRFRMDEPDEDQLEAVRSRVRSRSRGGRSYVSEGSEPVEVRARSVGRVSDYNGLGASLSELRKLSGMRES